MHSFIEFLILFRWQESYEAHYAYPYEGRFIDLGAITGMFHNLSWGRDLVSFFIFLTV